MIQDFSPSWWNKAEEEEEDNEDEKGALSGATRGTLGDDEEVDDGNEADAEDEDEDEDKEEPGRKKFKLNQ